MAAQTAHPPDDLLVAFGLGKLDDSSAETVLAHLETCSDCKRRVAQAPADSFVGRLRQAGETPAPGESLIDQPTGGHADLPVTSLPPEMAVWHQYTDVRELGRGGMGVVYLARNALMDRLEVLKVINHAQLGRAGSVERFVREIQSAARLRHPNVVVAYSAQQLGELIVFAMEYVPGDDLAKVVKARGPLPVVHACYYTFHAALGLQHAHEKGMVHRDIKPSNLILAREGKKHQVKVLDFGLAKGVGTAEVDGGLTGEGKMLGTPDYIAPEQTLDAAKADIRSDIYSLGCSLYYLLAGRPPFTGPTLFALLQAHHETEATRLNVLRPEVPDELAAVVAKMMTKDPAQRYQTPAEVTAALKPFLTRRPPARPGVGQGRTVQATMMAVASPFIPVGRLEGSRIQTMAAMPSPLVPPPAPAERPRRRWKWPAAVAALVLVGLLAAAAGVVLIRTKDGVIELRELPADAEVFVDGSRVSVAWDAGKQTAELRLKPGTRKLEVRQGEVVVLGEEVVVERGGRTVLVARVKPAEPPPAVVDEKPTSPPVDEPKLIWQWSHSVNNGPWEHNFRFRSDGKITGPHGQFAFGEWQLLNGNRTVTLTWYHNGFSDYLTSSDGVNFSGFNRLQTPIRGTLASLP